MGQATTLPNVQTVHDNAQTLNTAMKGLRDSIANEATIKQVKTILMQVKTNKLTTTMQFLQQKQSWSNIKSNNECARNQSSERPSDS